MSLCLRPIVLLNVSLTAELRLAFHASATHLRVIQIDVTEPHPPVPRSSREEA